MEIRSIRTEEDYEAALAEIDSIFGADPNSPEGERAEVLVTLVEAYESQHYPIPLPDPIGAIEFHMDRLGLTPRDLEQYIGTRTRVWEVLNRKRPLSLRMIRNLEKGLGIPAAILVQEYELATQPASAGEPALSAASMDRRAELVFESTETVLQAFSQATRQVNSAGVVDLVYKTSEAFWRSLLRRGTVEPARYEVAQSEASGIPVTTWPQPRGAERMNLVSDAGESGHD